LWKANLWNGQNSAINHNYSEIELVCDLSEDLGDLQLWVCPGDSKIEQSSTVS
jgi:hypothetical protein